MRTKTRNGLFDWLETRSSPGTPRRAPRVLPLWIALALTSVGCANDQPEERGQTGSPRQGDDDEDDAIGSDDDSDDAVRDAARPATPRIDASVARDGGTRPEPRIDASMSSGAERDAATARDAPTTKPGDGSEPTAPTGPLPPVPDGSKDGPYKSTTLSNTGPNGGYTVYLPSELGVDGVKHPIIGWMSGGGTMHQLYPLLPRLATQGFVVVAANVTPGIGAEVMLGKQIIAGIDWAIAENARMESPLFGKLATDRIASMGYSMGSLATFTIASDPRLTTTVHISGGNMDPSQIKNLRAPAAFLCGTPGDATCNILSPSCDIAAVNCDTDFELATTPVFYGNFEGGHLGILGEPLAGQIGTVASNWLRWKLFGDTALDSMFLTDDCIVCKDSKWKVQRKNLP